MNAHNLRHSQLRIDYLNASTRPTARLTVIVNSTFWYCTCSAHFFNFASTQRKRLQLTQLPDASTSPAHSGPWITPALAEGPWLQTILNSVANLWLLYLHFPRLFTPNLNTNPSRISTLVHQILWLPSALKLPEWNPTCLLCLLPPVSMVTGISDIPSPPPLFDATLFNKLLLSAQLLSSGLLRVVNV